MNINLYLSILIIAVSSIFSSFFFYKLGKAVGKKRRTMNQFLLSLPENSHVRFFYQGPRHQARQRNSNGRNLRRDLNVIDDPVHQVFCVQVLEDPGQLKVGSKRKFTVIHDEIVDHFSFRDDPERMSSGRRFDFDTGVFRVSFSRTFDRSKNRMIVKPTLARIE